jgi:hypothetical protein
VLKALIYKGFQLSQSFTLDINVTHSTWASCGNISTGLQSLILLVYCHIIAYDLCKINYDRHNFEDKYIIIGK